MPSSRLVLGFGLLLALGTARAEDPSTRAFREEIVATLAAYPLRVSVEPGREHRHLSSVPRGGAVVSLGSGPDLLRPLLDFPHAEEIHLVDHLRGWGRGPEAVLAEIESRALSLGKDAELRTVRWGFRRGFPGGRLGRAPLEARSPWVFDVTWTSAAFGKVRRRFFVHPLDFSRKAPSAEIERRFRRRRLSGILATGFQPMPDIVGALSNRLPLGGAIVLDLVAGGRTPAAFSLLWSGRYRHVRVRDCAGYLLDGTFTVSRDVVFRRVR